MLNRISNSNLGVALHLRYQKRGALRVAEVSSDLRTCAVDVPGLMKPFREVFRILEPSICGLWMSLHDYVWVFAVWKTL